MSSAAAIATPSGRDGLVPLGRGTVFARMRARVYEAVDAAPEHWDGLDAKQLVMIVRALRTSRSMEEVRTRICWVLLGVKWNTWRLNAALFFFLSAEERYRLGKVLSAPFLSREDGAWRMEKTVMKELRTTPSGAARHLPLRRGRSSVLVCCTDDLLNEVDAMTWGLADTCFVKYNTAVQRGMPQAMDLLRAMAAALYAPKDMSREDRLRGVHLALLDKVSEDQLHALHVNWSGMRAVWEKEAPHVFGAMTGKKVVRKLRGWTDVLRDLSGGKFGAYPETGATPARIFLKELNDRVEEQKRREEHARELAAKRRSMTRTH